MTVAESVVAVPVTTGFGVAVAELVVVGFFLTVMAGPPLKFSNV
ncbi:hypothetical protein [Dietzia sp. 179-F 9C3 NHS]